MPMLQSLASLRGIFALMIFAHHVEWRGESLLLVGGDSAVAFFFMLSGFVLVWSNAGRPAPRYRDFVARRLRRIVPLHWVMLAAAAVLALVMGQHVSPKLMAVNAALMQAWAPTRDIYFSFNSLSWFLSVLAFAYLMFPLIMRLRQRRFGLYIALGGGLAVGALCVALLVPPDRVDYLSYICPPVRLADFVLGMLLADVVLRLRPRLVTLKTPAVTVFEALGVAVLVVAMLAYPSVHHGLALGAYWWPVMALLIVAFATADINAASRGPISRALLLRPLILLGDISFAIYIVHYVILKAARHALGDADVAVALASLVLTLVAAVLLTRRGSTSAAK